MAYQRLTSKPLIFLYVLAVSDGILQASVVWTTMLFLTHINYTNIHTDPTSSFFVLISGLEFLTPALLSAPISTLASTHGALFALSLGHLCMFTSMLLYLISRASRIIYCAAVMGFSMLWTTRIVRVSMIVRVVDPEMGTVAAALHQTCVSFGYVLGSLLWYVAQMWRGQIYVNSVLVFDRFSVVFAANGVMCAVLGIAATKILAGVDNRSRIMNSRNDSNDCNLNPSQPITSTKQSNYNAITGKLAERNSSSHTHADRLLLRQGICFFTTAMFLFRVCTGIVMTSNQAAMVNLFHVTDTQITWISLIESSLSCLLIFVLSRVSSFLDDRYLALVIIFIQTVAVSLYMPFFGPLTVVQSMCAFILMKLATMSFTGLCVSMLSTTLGRLYRHAYAGYVWTGGMMGMACGQFLLMRVIVPFTGTWKYGGFTMPVLIVMGMFCMQKTRKTFREYPPLRS